jgi:RHS repeat-associated protein
MARAATGFVNFYTYTGREWDKETGLYYYRARYYDPMEGRFIQKDPIGFKGGVNIYAYTKNNPINFRDPTGLLSYPDPFALLGYIGCMIPCIMAEVINRPTYGLSDPAADMGTFINNLGSAIATCHQKCKRNCMAEVPSFNVSMPNPQTASVAVMITGIIVMVLLIPIGI